MQGTTPNRVVPQANHADLNALLRLVSTRALVLTGGTGAAVALLQQGSMICRASVGASAPGLGCQLDTRSGFSGECVRTGKALRCDDSETDPRVEVNSCRRLGIRSILAAPILLGRNVIGLLEVFSSQPFAFDDGHLAVVERLAQMTLPAPPREVTPPPRQKITPPKLLVEREPAYRVFFCNLNDLVRPPRTAPLKLTSAPAPFWPDVFVPARLPWERFLQSMVVHAVMIMALGGLLEFWLSQRHTVQRMAFRKSEVIYFSPSEYLEALGRGKATLRAPRKGQAGVTLPPVIKVAREKGNHTQASTAPPALQLKPQVQLLRLVAWNSVVPAVPMSAITRPRLTTPSDLAAVVAPPPDIRHARGRGTLAEMNPAAVVGPPPEISSLGGSRAVNAPKSAVIGPPPEVAVSSGPRSMSVPTATVIGPPPSARQLVRRIGGVNVGYVEVVAPAPQMSQREQGTLQAMVQASLRGTETAVVPPPPSVSGSGSPGGSRISSLSAAATPVVPPPAVVRSASSVSRRSSPITSAALVSAALPPNVPPPARWVDDSEETFTGSKEMSVNFIGLALALPASSYFSSHEVFIAEGRFSRDQSRLIKLVYEYLPYQSPLSDYGPNYPALDRLRVTRDPSCDEKLARAVAAVDLPGWRRPDRVQQALKSSGRPESTLECYRTTADDYRRARAHHR